MWNREGGGAKSRERGKRGREEEKERRVLEGERVEGEEEAEKPSDSIRVGAIQASLRPTKPLSGHRGGFIVYHFHLALLSTLSSS